jgi:hypothetical protein
MIADTQITGYSTEKIIVFWPEKTNEKDFYTSGSIVWSDKHTGFCKMVSAKNNLQQSASAGKDLLCWITEGLQRIRCEHQIPGNYIPAWRFNNSNRNGKFARTIS